MSALATPPGRTPVPAGPTADARLVLPSVAIVEKTIAKARRTVSLALLGAGLIVCGVLAERSWLLREGQRIASQLAAAEQAAGAILLADERLTMSAKLAAATGEVAWIARYDKYLPEIDTAIARAIALAPPSVASRFDRETRVANDQLVVFERDSFEAVRAGDAGRARAVLESGAYVENKGILSLGTERFTGAMVESVRGELGTLRERADIVLALLAALAFLSGSFIWRKLGSSLDRSRGYFLDAQRVASNDMLTGVANRVSLRDALSAELLRAEAQGLSLAVLMIDLDRFKPVNDKLGHGVGDLVLKEVALRMSRVLRQGELVARYGGDEFVVLIPACGDAAMCAAIGGRLVRAVSAPMVVGGHAIEVGATVGVARFPDDATVDEELLQCADQALYQAKAERRGSVRGYDPAMADAPSAKALLERELRDAVREGQIVPFYQPIVDLESRRTLGLEILSRWQHPQRGLVPPLEFIPLAEASGAIGGLTLAVLRRACLDARGFDLEWRLSLNVAAAQIEDPSLAEQLLAVLHETGFDPRRLEIELTENALVRDIAAARCVIASLKAAGMTIALDDFGTGYSSLAYLSELPFDKIKIDRSFIRTMHERAESAKIIGAMVGLSHSLGVEVVAEGVETERDAEVLSRLGCGLAQGYLFARPMAAAEVMQAEAAGRVALRLA